MCAKSFYLKFLSFIKMNVSIVKSNKGKEKLFVDGFDYHLDIKTGDIYRWSCSQRKQKNCKCRVDTALIDGEHAVKRQTSQHQHDPPASKKTIDETNNKLKSTARTSSLCPARIITNSIVETKPNCRRYLPSSQAQRRKIQRIRMNSIKEPRSLDEICIPDHLKYLEGELFVLSDKQFQGQRNIMLGTKRSLSLLGESNCWLMDGTFYVVPSIMRQLFSVHGRIDGQIVPLIFCLMSQKSKLAYEEFFYELCLLACERGISLNPERIISDFEISIPSAAKMFFPAANFKGCIFHFGQIIWRQVQKQGLATKYGNNEEFNLKVRMLKSLAFVPTNEVGTYFSLLNDYVEDPDWKTIARWFNKTYVNGIKNMKPRYSLEFWSIGDKVSQNFPRTQNSVEGWHNRIKIIIGKKNCGLYAIINGIKDEMVVIFNKIEKIKSGEVVNKRKKIIQQSEHIRELLQKRQNMDIIEYLKAISYNISLC